MRLLFTTIILTCLAQPLWAGSLVEIQLIDKLDEPRGYCIDIRGHKERAKVQKGLQAHTCYSYQGKLGVDQAFEKKMIIQGKFYLPAFDVCMKAEGGVEGSGLSLEACNDTDAQKFKFTSNDQIKLISNDEMCIAINASGSRKGGGGMPLHLLRSLSLRNCENVGTRYTTWRLVAPSSN